MDCLANISHCEEAERISAALMHAEIDLAYLFLRLAVSQSYLDATPRAAELVERAILGHKTVMRHLENMPTELEQEKHGLECAAGKLLEAIVSAERQFQILQGSRRPGVATSRSKTSGSPALKGWRIVKRQAC